MKALLLPEPGDCETVTVGELPIPEPGPGGNPGEGSGEWGQSL